MSSRSGIGTTITFGTSGFTGLVRALNGIGMSRESLDMTHMGSPAGSTFTGVIFREKEPGDLADSNDITVDILWDPDENTLPIDQDPETITIQFRPVAGQSTGASWSFTGYMADWSADVPYDGLITGSYTLVVSGEPTWTAGTV